MASLTALVREREAYLAHITVERGLSGNTIAAYRRDLERYSQFLLSRQVDGMARAGAADVAAFAEAVGTGSDGKSALAPASANRVIVAVRGWHRFAAAEGWADDDVSRQVRPRAVPQRLPKAISTDAVATILDHAETGSAPLRDRALLELLYATGARISEATGLDVDDVDTGRESPAVRLLGKGSKERVVPLGGFALDALEAYLVRGRSPLAMRGRGTPALFLNSRGARLTRQSAWAILRATCERAGVSGVSPHTFRHSFATHLLAGGADVRVVQELLGHASVTTTQIYTAVTPDALREVYLSSHPRARIER